MKTAYLLHQYQEKIDVSGNKVPVDIFSRKVVSYRQYEVMNMNGELVPTYNYLVRCRALIFSDNNITPFYAEYEEDINVNPETSYDHLTLAEKVFAVDGELYKTFTRLCDESQKENFVEMVRSNEEKFSAQLKDSSIKISIPDEEIREMLLPYTQYKNYSVYIYGETGEKIWSQYTQKDTALEQAEIQRENTRSSFLFPHIFNDIGGKKGTRVYEIDCATNKRKLIEEKAIQ